MWGYEKIIVTCKNETKNVIFDDQYSMWYADNFGPKLSAHQIVIELALLQSKVSKKGSQWQNTQLLQQEQDNMMKKH